jgi:hypothetical protein
MQDQVEVKVEKKINVGEGDLTENYEVLTAAQQFERRKFLRLSPLEYPSLHCDQPSAIFDRWKKM